MKSPDFEVASVAWNDDWTDKAPDGFLRSPVKKGTYPDGSLQNDRHLKIEVCCRQDEFVATGINLPVGKIFFTSLVVVSDVSVVLK